MSSAAGLEAFGWRSIFYALAAVGLVWTAIFAIFTSSSPKHAVGHLLIPLHPSELALISSSEGEEGTTQAPGTGVGEDPEEDVGAMYSDAAEEERLLSGYAGGHGAAAEDRECEEVSAGLKSWLGRGEDGLGANCGCGGRKGWAKGTPFSVPWGKIARSPSCWAIFAGHTTYTWSFYLLLTQLPSYLQLAVGLEGEAAAVASALPYVAMCTLSVCGGLVADMLIAARILSTASTRKVMFSFGLVGSALWLVAAGHFVDAKWSRGTQNTPETHGVSMPPPVVLLIAAGAGTEALAISGYNANYMEVGGRYCVYARVCIEVFDYTNTYVFRADVLYCIYFSIVIRLAGVLLSSRMTFFSCTIVISDNMK